MVQTLAAWLSFDKNGRKCQVCGEKISNNRCYAHLPNVLGDIRPFKEATWSTYLRRVEIWKDLVGNQADIARCFVRDHGGVTCRLDEIPIPEDDGYHRKCYNYFTDSSKQARAAKKKQNEKASSLAVFLLTNMRTSIFFLAVFVTMVTADDSKNVTCSDCPPGPVGTKGVKGEMGIAGYPGEPGDPGQVYYRGTTSECGSGPYPSGNQETKWILVLLVKRRTRCAWK